jgi:hypothetical protein
MNFFAKNVLIYYIPKVNDLKKVNTYIWNFFMKLEMSDVKNAIINDKTVLSVEIGST